MASSKSITVKVVLETKAGKSNVPTPTPTPTPNQEEEVKEKTQNNSMSLLASVVVNEAFQQTKKIVKNLATYSLNRYFNLTEDYMSEQTMNNVLTAINKTTSLFATTAGGAVAGFSAGGPVGAIIAGSVALVGYSINDYIEKQKRWQTARLSQQNANYNREFSAVRAGLVDGSKGTMN